MEILRILIVGYYVMFFPLVVHAQVEEVLSDQTTLDDLETTDWSQNYELLSDLYEHPLNLNSATPDDLRQIPFLTEEQIEELSEYLYRYGPIKTVGELAMLKSFDGDSRERLLQFSYLGSAHTDSLSKTRFMRGRHELLALGRIPFYLRKGDKEEYLGPPYRHSFRYTFEGHYLKAGLIGAQDAGEPFFANRNSFGYDHYSFFIQLKDLSRLKNIIVGRYRLHFAQGLVMNNDFSLGKLVALSNAARSYTTLRGHTSRMQYNYLQGVAATLSMNQFVDLTSFFSYRPIDATLNTSSEPVTIRTILSSDYHRTPSEMKNKNNAHELIAGSRLSYRQECWHAGLTAVYNAFDMSLQPLPENAESQHYRRYHPTGQTFWNASADYGYHSPVFTFSGETATGSCKAVATLNTAVLKLNRRLSLTLLQRFYSYRYYALHSQSLSEGSSVQNESGILFAINWQPLRNITVIGYSDYVYFPWTRYLVSNQSHAWDHLLSTIWRHEQWQVSTRYRVRLRQRDAISQDENTTAEKKLTNRVEQRLRMTATYTVGSFLWKTQADLAYQNDRQSSSPHHSLGWMLSSTATYKSNQTTLKGLVAYFHTDDYDSRVYLYEPSLPHTIVFPMLYGEGMRLVVLAQTRLSDNLHFVAKMATTKYFDRDVIGTGLQQINKSWQSDVDLLLRWSF